MTTPLPDPGFSTAGVAPLLTPAARVTAMCRVEAALARASASAGILPADVAARVAARCDDGVADPDQVLVEGWERGTPVLPLLDRLRSGLDEDAAAALHRGATTQDVVDTAAMLQLRAALPVVRADLASAARDLRRLALLHRGTTTTAWTFLQPAVPTTVGRRCAGWLAPVVDHLRDLRETADALPVQLGGPTGTLGAFGEHHAQVVESVAGELGLAVPLLPWHTDRSPVRSAVTTLEGTARTAARIAGDLALLAHDGVATMRAGGSSSMPDKRNPVDAVRAVAAAEACSGAATTVLRGRAHELERGVGGWHAEWLAVPLVVHTTAAAVEALARATGSLELVGDDAAGAGRTAATDAAIDRVVAACDAELAHVPTDEEGSR